MARGKSTVTPHIWTKEEKDYLKEITPGKHYKEIQELMKNKFNLEFTMNQIKGAICRYKLNTGFTGRFQKGDIPFNKGKSQKDYMSAESIEKTKKTRFKKGQSPINWRPVGSERITKDGYTEIKIAEPNVWELKHKVLWEREHGSIPPKHVVIFADGNKENLDINNLMLISREKLLIMNTNELIKKDAELTKTGALIADVLIKVRRRKKIDGKDKNYSY